MSTKKTTRKSTVERRPLRLEGLERRELMAGNVFALMDTSGTLHIGGDSQSNAAQVRQISANQWRVEGMTHAGSTTKINNSANSAVFTGVKALNVNLNAGNDRLDIGSPSSLHPTSQLPGGMKVVTGAGDDVVTINRVSTYLGANIDTGLGNDKVIINSTNLGSTADEFRRGGLNVLTGNGADVVELTGLSVVGAAYINTGVGNSANSVSVRDSLFSGDLMIDTQELDYFQNEGSLTTKIERVQVKGKLTVNTQNTQAFTTINSTRADSLYARMGAKNDSLTMNNVSARQGEANGGAGLDYLSKTNVSGLRTISFELPFTIKR